MMSANARKQGMRGQWWVLKDMVHNRSFNSSYFDMLWQKKHRCKLLITFRCACPTEHAGSLEDLTEMFNCV